MPTTCCVVGCNNRSNRDREKRFYTFPTVIKHHNDAKTTEISSGRRHRWIAGVKRVDWQPTKTSRICSDHFINGKPAKLYDVNNPDWVPTRNMGYKKKSASPSKSTSRYMRQQMRNIKRQSCLQVNSKNDVECDSAAAPNESVEFADAETGVACQTNDNWLRDMENENQQLKVDNKWLREELDKSKNIIESLSLSEGSFMKDEGKLQFYTGLPFVGTFVLLLKLAAPSLKTSEKLTYFQRLLMFFLKIRLNLLDEDIAYRFHVHRSTVSRNFHYVLKVLAVKLGTLIHWPSRDDLRMSMPLCFRKFFKQCAVIIDCTEIFIERPAQLLARAQVWSNYKQNSTIKFLIGITPQGTISFLSDAWGGRASDKLITEESGIIDLLLPGDSVLADRGFLISDSVNMVMAEVKMPPFTKGKKQLSKVEVDWSRELSAVRIHIERVIGLIKNKYTIFQGTLPINFVKSETDNNAIVTDLMKVCCSLINICPPIVPLE